MRIQKTRFLIYGVIAVIAMISIGSQLTAAENEQVIQITARKFEYSPQEITVKKGVPVVLEFTSLDRLHGFNCPGLKLRTDILPGKTNTLRFTPDKAGTFPFHCDVFCGSGHEGMSGTVTVRNDSARIETSRMPMKDELIWEGSGPSIVGWECQSPCFYSYRQ